jgi:hypothetical protein
MEDIMQPYSRSSWTIWTLTATSIGSLAVLALVAACSNGTGETSEIDGYYSAVQTQNVNAAHAFVSQYRTSHLVGDLIESLRPDVALQICENLPAGTAREGVRSCRQLQDTIATNPAAPNEPIQIAASASNATPTTSFDCIGTRYVVTPTVSTSTTKVQRAATAPDRARSKQKPARQYWMIASAKRGNKEARY